MLLFRHERVLFRFGRSLDPVAMRSAGQMNGEARQYEDPDWGPLKALLASDELCDYFMWMGDVQLEDGTILNEYKHRWTRRYLHLTHDRRAFSYAGNDSYEQLPLYVAVSVVFVDWLCCDPTPTEKAALFKVLIAAG